MQDSRPHAAERYSPGYGTEVVSSFQGRSVRVEAAFFQRWLRPGMQLLDCGCGPGTISAGLAALVHPGTVIGIDREASQVELAAAHCREQQIANAQFQSASVYELPFPDDSFDAAFANGLLQHLAQPVRALVEIRRVLKPGGVIGIRDDDQGTLVIAPPSAESDRIVDLIKRIMRHGGGDPCLARRHRQLLREAGFTGIEGSASVEWDGTPESTTRRGDLGGALLEQMSPVAVAQGWATADEVRELAAVCRAWGRHPDAFDVITWCEAVGRK
jgi:SAM-dependent methyltransferase